MKNNRLLTVFHFAPSPGSAENARKTQARHQSHGLAARNKQRTAKLALHDLASGSTTANRGRNYDLVVADEANSV